MPIWKIAAGVFLGNLLFAVLAWVFMAVVWSGARQEAMGTATQAQLRQLQAERRADNVMAKP